MLSDYFNNEEKKALFRYPFIRDFLNGKTDEKTFAEVFKAFDEQLMDDKTIDHHLIEFLAYFYYGRLSLNDAEDILKNVQDIDRPGIAFSALLTYRKIDDTLKSGLLGGFAHDTDSDVVSR